MATLMRVNGSTEEVHPKKGKVFTLEELQGFVGGYIERVPLGNDRYMWLNEEGKLHDLPLNERATVLAIGSGAIHPHDCVVGDVLIEKGETD